MYSEFVRKVMQSAIISSPTADIIISGRKLTQVSMIGAKTFDIVIPEDEIEVSNNILENILRKETECIRNFRR